MSDYPKTIANEAQLDELLALPDQMLIDFMKRLEGDIAILGIGGKMGPTMGRLAVNAIKAAGTVDTNTTYSAATTEALGLVKQTAAVTDATSETVTAQLNALLSALRTAGIVAAE